MLKQKKSERKSKAAFKFVSLVDCLVVVLKVGARFVYIWHSLSNPTIKFRHIQFAFANAEITFLTTISNIPLEAIPTKGVIIQII